MSSCLDKIFKIRSRSEAKDTFIWSDDEIEFLLKVTQEYEFTQISQNVD